MTVKTAGFTSEAMGGLAAMLVALPSAIAFGVIVFSPLGGAYAGMGALAGVVGTAALGLVAALLGGTDRLISAPCAPAAAVLGAFAFESMADGIAPPQIVVMLTLTGLICGFVQIGFGMVGLGRLIKYVPYPVVSGYLSGVGLVIITNQIPQVLGTPKGTGLIQALTHSNLWNWQSIAIAVASVVVMAGAPRLTKAIPAAILALVAGIATLGALGLADPTVLRLHDNPLIVGPLGGSGHGLTQSMAVHWQGIGHLNWATLAALAIPTATLAALLSIDTLKTCVVLDTLTRSRHRSNRELIGQGCANVVSALVGGMPGAGQMGATLVNMSSGGRTRLSGVLEGVFAVVAFLALGSLVAWVPIASLGGILVVVGLRMIDWKSLRLIRSKATLADFLVIIAVIVVAMTVSLIAASGAGVGLSILLFVREQIGGDAVRRKVAGNHLPSKQSRDPSDMAILHAKGDQTMVVELQGSLFFGTADQLYTALEPEAKSRAQLILDFRRVQSVDVSAVHVLHLVSDIVAEHGGALMLCSLSNIHALGQDVAAYFAMAGLDMADGTIQVAETLDDALQWAEDRILSRERQSPPSELALNLADFSLFAGRKDETLALLEGQMETRRFNTGEVIFETGETGDELFLVRRGAVRVVLPMSDGPDFHLASFGRGNFFGEMAFLDNQSRSARALAEGEVELYVLSRAHFDAISAEHKKMAIGLLSGLAATLALRLRYANAELKVAWES